MKWSSLIFLFFLLLTSCRFPEDPKQTLNHILNTRVLIIGYCSPPLDHPVTQIENNLLEKLATSLNAEVIQIFDAQENLYRKLQENKINILACRIQTISPWHSQVAFTNSYHQEQDNKQQIAYVFALPPGENAWLSYVNHFIFMNRK